MKLIEKNGKVNYLMKAGNDYVSAEMPVGDAERIIANGNKRASNRFPGYPISVDDQYFFAAKSGKADKSDDEKEPVTEE